MNFEKNCNKKGAASGIGEALVNSLLKRKCIIYACDINESLLREKFGNQKRVICKKLDVTNQSEVNEISKFVSNSKYGLFAIINNAGIGSIPGSNIQYFKSVGEANVDSEILPFFNVNTFGLMRVTSALLKYLFHPSNQNKGTVVNIASVAGRIGAGAMLGTYGASKHAVVGYSDSLRKDLRGYARVICVEPGFTNTNILSPFKESTLRVDQSKTIIPEEKWKRILNAYLKLEKLQSSGKLIEPSYVAEQICEALFQDPAPPHLVIDRFVLKLFWYFLFIAPSFIGDFFIRLFLEN